MPYYAVGVDVTEIVDRNQALSGDPLTANYHCVYTGRDPVLLPPRTFALWTRAHSEPVEYAELEASLGFEDPEDRREYLRDELRGKLVFAEWPWYISDSPYADAMQLVLVGTDGLPNPEPTVFSRDLWHHTPTLAQLERAYQQVGASFGSARRALIDQVPAWFAASGGVLRLQLLPRLKDLLLLAEGSPE